MNRDLTSRTRCWLVTALLVVAAACGRQVVPLRTGADGLPQLPRPAASYSTDARPGGLVGDGAEDVGELVEELGARGQDPKPDGALGAVAVWALREAYGGRRPDPQLLVPMAKRFGFAGVVYTTAANSLEHQDMRSFVRSLVAGVPSNHPITRYGVAAAHGGREAAVVLGSVEASLQPIPRTMAPGATLELRGKVGERFERAGVFVTDAQGAVREMPLRSREVESTLRFDTTGAYQVEVMGYGADGVVVLVNVPIWVGVAEQHAQQGSGPGTVTFDPAVAEARLLELVNDARQRAGVPPLPADPELRAVALAHSQDMAQHGFIGHVSPSTGRVDDRVLRAGVRVSVMGENVASHTTPETCHDFLMGSPGHRANILRRDFTHVGIGVVIHPGAGEPQVYATQVFGRRPAPSEVRPTAEAIVEAIHHFRQARGLQAASTDPVLSAAAAAGVRAYVASMPRSHQRAAQAVSASIDAHVNRTRQGRPASCIMLVELLERAQLVVTPSILDRNLRRFGVAVDVLEQHETPRSAVMLVLEGTDKGPVVCH